MLPLDPLEAPAPPDGPELAEPDELEELDEVLPPRPTPPLPPLPPEAKAALGATSANTTATAGTTIADSAAARILSTLLAMTPGIGPYVAPREGNPSRSGRSTYRVVISTTAHLPRLGGTIEKDARASFSAVPDRFRPG